MAPPVRDLRLGRAQFVTLKDDVGEGIGADLQIDEGAVATARHRPKKFTQTIPVFGGSGDANPYSSGLRMRRQIRAMIENGLYRDQTLYMAFNPDPELNGWMHLGGGTITYFEGGVSLAHFQFEVDNAYRRGSLRTHRAGRRVELYDRVLATVPRDFRGVVFASDWASLRGTGTGPYLATGQPTFLPVGVTDGLASAAFNYNRSPVALYARAGIDGTGYFAVGLAHGNVVSFEQTEANQNLGDVVVWDRQTFTAPTYTLLGDTNPQDATNGYGWEEVYGADQPLTASDMVVMANGLCRIRLVTTTNSLAVDTYVAGTGYVEQGRITIWDSLAQDTYVQHAYPIPQNNAAYGTVMEYTPDRAIVRLATTRATAADEATARIETYITLQRGWTGPRLEAYCAAPGVAQPGCQLRWTANTTASIVQAAPASAQVFAGDDALFGWAQTPGPTFLSLSEPWVVAQPAASTSTAVATTVVSLMQSARLPSYLDNTAYGSTNRPSLGVTARQGEAQATNLYGYVSARLGFGLPGAIAVFEAETYMNAGGTRTSVADGAASAGNAINDTQVTNAAATVSASGAQFGAVQPLGRVGIWARVRVTTTGDTMSVLATVNAVSTTAVTTASTTYVWLYLGDLAHGATSDTLTLSAWRSAGTGTTGVRVDRVVLAPTERRVAGTVAHDGARDIAGQGLYDARGIFELVAR